MWVRERQLRSAMSPRVDQIKRRRCKCNPRPLEIGGVEVSLNAEYPAAPLLLCTGETAEQPALLLGGLDGNVGKESTLLDSVRLEDVWSARNDSSIHSFRRG